ncbi:hypothetical protein VP01_3517g5 [Puccinia sorghi]|uniref:Uncharacterized protein n=1 Tax=Puccinia sorghi TaxID=27349 RepID=A0A0L6UXJ1_9BASI|nr:hypothetical protein VP01_3517g5 [Puccinia sorghi]
MSNFFEQNPFGRNQTHLVTQLQNDLAQKNELIAQLIQRVEALELSTPQSSSKKKKDTSAHITGSKNMTSSAVPALTSAKQQRATTNSPKTPVNERANSTTPAPPTTSAKKNPLQMVSGEQPQGFEWTRVSYFFFEAFYLHIKVLWGLIEVGAIPTPPNPDQLREFNQRFSSSDQIENAISNCGGDLVAIDQIETLRNARMNRKKVGKNIYHMSEMLISYIHTSLARIGIRKWGPDLDAQPDSLYNEACRISAIRTFRQAVAGEAYSYMSINKCFVNDLNLLIQTKKEEGKHHKDEEKKVIQRWLKNVQLQLRDACYKFAINNGFPKRYIKIIKPIPAHRNDEYNASKDLYIVKNLPYCSETANKFFKRLDDVMRDSFKNEGIRDQSQKWERIKNAPMTIFPKAPKGLPIDFYDPEWFNERLPTQKRVIADVHSVAFLPSPKDSFRPKKLAKKWSNKKFSEKFWEDATKKYDLDFLVVNESDKDDDDEEGDSDYGGSIDLKAESNGSDEEDEADYKSNKSVEEIAGKGKGKAREVNEDYKEFDQDEEMYTTSQPPQVAYNGGMNTEKWNQWQ